MTTTATSEVRYAPKLDVSLIETDNLLKRWAAGERVGAGGGLHPLEAIRLLHDGAVLGGSDAPVAEEIMILDEIISTGPKDTRAFLQVWYQNSSPVYLKARRLGISRTLIYTKHKEHLQYIRGRLHGRGVNV
jgi:hypothetical protein